MLNLSGAFKYYLCTEPVTLRYRHRGLREYIRRCLHRDPMNGDVYIFLSRDFTRLRVYYFHHKGEILTEKILHNNRYVTPVFEDTEKNVYRIAWKDFVYLLEGVIRKEKTEYFDEEPDEDDNDSVDNNI